MSKIFTTTATDGQWSLPLLDTISQQNLGILTPSAVYSWAQAEYAAGLMAWRIQRSDNLAVSRRGFGVLAGENCMSEASMPPTRITPTDILTVYALPVDATVAEANVLAWIDTTKGTELFGIGSVPNDTPTEVKSVINGMTLGDAFFNSTMRSITVQCEDGAVLDKVEILDAQGGVQWTAMGNVRGTGPASRSNEYNLMVDGMALAITKGYSIKVTTVAA
tara:strand:+ start:138 stop:797 length:660 start_codon:yes stop_codon:yes gene_type:complete